MDKLAIACEMSLEKWSETFPEVIPEPEYSKKHEKWKKKLFDKMRNDRYHKFTTKTVKVMLIAAVLCALLLTAFVIPSSREFMLDKFGEYSTCKLTENNKNSVSGEITVGCVPEGYVLSKTDISNKATQVEYISNNDDFFTIFKYSSAVKVDFDTESFTTEEIIVNKIKYLYCQGNEDINNLVWTKNDYVYRLDGSLSKDEMIKVAKMVE